MIAASKKIFGNRWEIIESLSEGGQGYIYRVKDLKTGDSNYVLKKLKNKDRKDRFEKEIKAVNSIDSSYIEKIIDFKDTEDDDFYYVMQYREKSLHNILPDLKGNLIRILEIFSKICQGMKDAYTREKPIIHRDLKPTNILIDKEDNPKIIDFGLCFLDSSVRITLTQEQVGSRYYMAPECEIGKSEDIGIHTDIYSLGKILYAMVSGGQIFPRERQLEDKYNLENILSDMRVRYINQIINNCVKEKTSQRLNNIDNLISIVDKTKCLIKDGFFPVCYGNEICRFCGIGKLEKFGKLRGSILEQGSVQYDISSFNITMWRCNECGIVYNFEEDIYRNHKV